MPQNLFDDLKGKNCIITGGAGVIGCSLVECLARAGVNVAILDLNAGLAVKKAKEIALSTGGTVMGLGGNVLEKQSLADAKKTVNEQLGPIDILINAAGGNNPKATTAVETIEDKDLDHLEGTFFGLEMEAFRKVFDLNFIGTLIPSMVFTRDMIERKRGVILNISSMNSYRPLTRIPAYSAAKASINNFTAWLAVHLAQQNIRVNAIAPGFFLTDQNRFLMYDQATGNLSARGDKIIAGTPMKRFGTPDELQGSLLYLVSDLSKFVTGIVLPVDGGFSAYSGV
ncbi:MAG: SDR family oxidoreductase [Chitinispirillaceae bacterium]|jgi:NAD(P)-dependent dehydrogenase (short-subunit alcohol dehydrogenase family)